MIGSSIISKQLATWYAGVKDRILRPGFAVVLIRTIPSHCCCALFCLIRISLWPEGSSSVSPGNLLKCISEETSLFCQMTLRWPNTPVFQGSLGQPGTAVSQQMIFLCLKQGIVGSREEEERLNLWVQVEMGQDRCQDVLLHCCKSLASRVSWVLLGWCDMTQNTSHRKLEVFLLSSYCFSEPFTVFTTMEKLIRSMQQKWLQCVMDGGASVQNCSPQQAGGVSAEKPGANGPGWASEPWPQRARHAACSCPPLTKALVAQERPPAVARTGEGMLWSEPPNRTLMFLYPGMDWTPSSWWKAPWLYSSMKENRWWSCSYWIMSQSIVFVGAWILHTGFLLVKKDTMFVWK